MKNILLITLAFIAVPTVEAAPISFPAPAGLRGYIVEDGLNNGPTGAADFRAGLEGGLEFRNYFGFAIPGFEGDLVGARLLLQASDFAYASPDGSETLALYSLPEIFGFNAIGSGTLYGSSSLSAANNGTVVAIELNTVAMMAILPGSFFQLGGVVTSLEGGADQSVLRFSEGATSILELDVEPIPEPSTVLFMLSGAAGMLWLRSRSRRKTLSE